MGVDQQPGSLRELFAAPNRRRCYLQVEAALAEAEAELGVIPGDAGAAIAGAAREGELDESQIAAGFAATGHSMMALRTGWASWRCPCRLARSSTTLPGWCVLAMLCATAQSIAEEVERLMTPEYGEVSEAIPAGDVGSSTMPQKRNPKQCGAVIIPAAHVRHLVPMALEAILQAHEVGGTRSVLIDRALEQRLRPLR